MNKMKWYKTTQLKFILISVFYVLLIVICSISCTHQQKDIVTTTEEKLYPACLNVQIDVPFSPYKKTEKKWGYINKYGDWIIPPEYEDTILGLEVQPTSVGYLFPTKRNEKWGFLNSDSHWIVKPIYAGNTSIQFRDDRALVSLAQDSNQTYFFIDPQGQKVFIVKDREPVGQFCEGIAWRYNYQNPGYMECINSDGERIVANIPVDEDYITNYHMRAYFSQGLLAVKSNGKWGYIDKNGHWLIPPQYNNALPFSEGYASVKKGDKYGYIDQKGSVVIDFQYDFAEKFSEGVAGVFQNGKWIFININNEKVFEHSFPGKLAIEEGSFEFHENLACVWGGNAWGYINKSAEWIIEPKFTKAYPFDSNNVAYVNLGNTGGYINSQGNWIYNWVM